MVRQTIKISGINGIALTKLDVLDELDEIKMCINYELNGKKIDYFQQRLEDQFRGINQYTKAFPGWKSSTKGTKSLKDLPKKPKNYIFAIRKIYRNKDFMCSTSPERKDTILIENPFSF